MMCYVCDRLLSGQYPLPIAKLHLERMKEGQNENPGDIAHYDIVLRQLSNGQKCNFCFFFPCRCSSGHADRLRKL